MSAIEATGDAGDGVADTVVARIEARRVSARRGLAATVDRREQAYRELVNSPDPVDQAIARVYRDFLVQVEQVQRSEAAMLLAADMDGDTVVGRVAVFDEDRELLVVPWHAPEGQRQLTARQRLMITERGDQPLAVHRLTADADALAERIRGGMRAAARREEMSDPLATLTSEQGEALEAIGTARGDVVLTGPPGSGKSAIVLVELARRVLSHPDPHTLRVLFVTGSPRLAQRAEVLGRLLGVASITPVPQAELGRLLGTGAGPTPIAGQHPGADGADVPEAIAGAFEDLRGRLARPDPIPHPLGSVDPHEVLAVRNWRARAGSSTYTQVAKGLRRDLAAEYARLIPGPATAARAEAAAERLRPVLTPIELVRRALGERTLPQALRRAATACARSLLETPAGQSAADWDLVVVDEYQRLPGLYLWLLRRRAGQLVLSGDPHQSFTDEDVEVTAAATAVALTTSLRLPAAISTWIDRFWLEHGLPQPGIRSAAVGGEVRTSAGAAERAGPHAQVLAPAGLAAQNDRWLSPLDALGLEWPEVVLLGPERILAEHGPPGLFVAATRAIDLLTLDPG
ncbi:hypothetical protein [Egicoccus sp. AB-alg6-2]|uniref:hypothetical protein n=1 Tax=Egicoccus sp. AB-alg6-2 TaxID=3242692 RepID=UPI00359D92F5